MGHCFSRNETTTKHRPPKRAASRSTAAAGGGGARNPSYRSRSTNRRREIVFHDHELAAAAIIFQQKLQNGGDDSDRSSSFALSRQLSKSRSYHQPFNRSSSSTTRSLDPLLPYPQLGSEDISLDHELETNHFVLVHGGGFGAWCWYKTISLLQVAGFRVTALDLTGSGVHSFDMNNVTSLSQYVKPLTDFLERLADGEKVILVGHDFGGACISYAMEHFSSKVSRAVFVAAAMLSSGQSALDIFSQHNNSSDLMSRAQTFIYANCNNKPTAIDLDKSLLRDLLFNQSPEKDVALATLCMRPIPFSPVLEKLTLSDVKYGLVRRFYIVTMEDNAVSIASQQSMIDQNPPEKVYHIRGSDHSPFFSKPQSLHRILVEISRLPSKTSSETHTDTNIGI